MPGHIPNSGPYVVSYRDSITGKLTEQEAHTWEFACQLMRRHLIDGRCFITVRFA